MIKDRNGILRDIYGRPVIMVFNWESRRSKQKGMVLDNADQVEGTKTEAQPVQFVHVSGTAKEDNAARTLIRTHVMGDYKRRRMLNKARACKRLRSMYAGQAPPQRDGYQFRAPFLAPQPCGSLDPFAKYPVQLQPYMYGLIQHCTCTPPQLLLPCALWKSHVANLRLLKILP